MSRFFMMTALVCLFKATGIDWGDNGLVMAREDAFSNSINHVFRLPGEMPTDEELEEDFLHGLLEDQELSEEKSKKTPPKKSSSPPTKPMDAMVTIFVREPPDKTCKPLSASLLDHLYGLVENGLDMEIYGNSQCSRELTLKEFLNLRKEKIMKKKKLLSKREKDDVEIEVKKMLNYLDIHFDDDDIKNLESMPMSVIQEAMTDAFLDF